MSLVHPAAGNSSDSEVEIENPYSPRGGNGSQSKVEELYGAFAGYCVSVNYILGVGVLGVPWVFNKSGYILSTILLAILSLVSYLCAFWVPEVLARAEGVVSRAELLTADGEPRDLLRSSSRGESYLAVGTEEMSDEDELSGRPFSEPKNYISHHRKFETNMLCGIFLNDYYRKVYEVSICLYLYGALWSYAAVLAASLTDNFPVSFINGGDACDVDKDHSTGCKSLYWFYLSIFAVFAVPMSIRELSEQKVIQVILAIFRFVALFTMAATSVNAMYGYPNEDLPKEYQEGGTPYLSDTPGFNFESKTVFVFFLFCSVSSLFFSFSFFFAFPPHSPYPTPSLLIHPSSLLTHHHLPSSHLIDISKLIPVAIYSQIFHPSIPGLIKPLIDKKKAQKVFGGVILTTFSFYTLVGVTISLYFGSATNETCSLNWTDYHGGNTGNPWWAKFISKMVVLFPPLDIISAFPLNVLTLGNSMLAMFIAKPEHQKRRKNVIMFRLIAGIPPLIGAFFVSSLQTILKYTGLMGIVIAFVYPGLLQLYSKRYMVKHFGVGADHTTYTHPILSSDIMVYTTLVLALVSLVTVIVFFFV